MATSKFTFPAPLAPAFPAQVAVTARVPRARVSTLPASISNPLAWVAHPTATAARHMASLCPAVTALTLHQLCQDNDLANLTVRLLEAPLDIPLCDDLAEVLQTLDDLLRQGLAARGMEANGAASRQLLLARLIPILAALEALQPVVEAAEAAVDGDSIAGLPYLQRVIGNHAGGGIATALATFSRKRVQRDLQRSVQRAARRDTLDPDVASPERLRAHYRALLDTAQTQSSTAAVGMLRPAGWLGMIATLVYAEALCGGLLAASLAGIINPDA